MVSQRKLNLKFCFICLILILFFLLGTSGCVTREKPPSPEPIKIGLLFPLSGDSSGFGNNCLNGTLLALEEINHAGGISSLRGVRLVPVIADSRGVPKNGAAETNRLIREEDVSAIIGTYHSSVAIASTEVSEKLKTPFIVCVGIADAITERGFEYLFRVIPKSEYYGENQVLFLQFLNNATRRGIHRVALLHENTGFGTAVALGQREALIREGFEPVSEVAYDAESALTLTREVDEILESRPDAILVTTYLRDSILIRKELGRAGSTIPFIDSAGGTTTARYISELGPSADGTFSLSEFSTHTSEGKELNDRYYHRFGENITGDGAYSYQAVWVLKDALERAGSTDREKIRDALSKTDMEKGDHMILPDERIRFDATGQNEYSQLFMLQIQHGELVPVWPENYATAQVILS